jgi:hypothetical protein
MATKSQPGKKQTDKTEPPTSDELLDDVDEAEDDRVAAEEGSEIADEDEAVVTDAREERVP